jgi:2-C-methyl-D-erythritol 4-phosphate cytidylyltransferase/2-C-methyl-D-erythritol 2,4-cyclodiphosphate synthase
MTVTALIVAAGSGQRLGGGVPKQYRLLGGKSVLRWAVEAFASHPLIDAVRVVIGAGHEELARTALDGVDIGEPISGGEHRSDSVRAGLAASGGEQVLVHDAARPFCPPPVIDRLLGALGSHDGAAPVLAIGDTLARAGELLGEPINRSGAVRVQTPQAFGLDALRHAYDRWTGEPPTDETSVARAAGLRVAAVEGDALLDKLTTAADWDRAERALRPSVGGRAQRAERRARHTRALAGNFVEGARLGLTLSRIRSRECHGGVLGRYRAKLLACLSRPP